MRGNNNRTKKLVKNIAIITIGSFLSKILSFLFLPLYTAVLSTEEYGTADLISTTVHLLIPFSTIVMGEAMMRFALGKEDDNKTIFSTGIHVCLFPMISSIVVATIIMRFTFLGQYTYILALNLAVSCLFSILSYFVRGIGEVKYYSVAGVINTFCIVLCNVLFLVVFKIGLIGYLFSTIIAETIAILFLLSHKNITKNISVSNKHYNKELARGMLRYSVPLVPNSVSWWISNSSDKYILTMFWGLSLNGIYSVSYKVPAIISMLVNIFSSAWLISAVDDFGTEKARQFYSNIYEKYISLSVVCVSGLIFLNKMLAGILFSDAYYTAWKYQPILIVGVAFHGIAGFLGSIYTSAKKTNMILVSTIIGAVGNIVLNFCFIPKYGAYGAAIATAFSYMIVWLIRAVDSRRIMILSVELRRIIASGIVLIIQLLCEYCIKNKFSIVSLILFILILITNRNIVVVIICQLRTVMKKIIKYKK